MKIRYFCCMIYRVLCDEIAETLNKYPIIGLTGPRQSGKTTLLKETLTDFRYISLENPEHREFAQNDPKGFLDEFNDKIIFDEVQNAPELFSYLQGIVDENQIMGQFVLSGSQNFNLMERITQTLAGRVALFRLFPFEMAEMKTAGWLLNDLSQVMTSGFYPALFQRNIDPDRYFADYLDTYVNRDVSQLVNVKDTMTFKAFLKLCAIRAGQLLNVNDLARDSGVSHTTARNWLSILETSYLVFQLPPYFQNFGKRLIKSSKLYFYDVGLLCHLLNIRKGKLSPTHPMWGHIFENLIICELIKQNAHHTLHRDYYFWRDSKGHEVDLLFQLGELLHVYEIKATSTIQNKLFDGLDYFDKITPQPLAQKTLIYGGDNQQNRTNYDVLPWMKTS